MCPKPPVNATALLAGHETRMPLSGNAVCEPNFHLADKP
jgi:hypothetical protein